MKWPKHLLLNTHFLCYYYTIMSDTGLVFLEAQEAQFDWTYMVTLPKIFISEKKIMLKLTLLCQGKERHNWRLFGRPFQSFRVSMRSVVGGCGTSCWRGLVCCLVALSDDLALQEYLRRSTKLTTHQVELNWRFLSMTLCSYCLLRTS